MEKNPSETAPIKGRPEDAGQTNQYTPEQQAKFKEELAPLVARRQSQTLKAAVAVVVLAAIAAIIGASVSPADRVDGAIKLSLIVTLLFAVIFSIFFRVKIACPGCGHDTELNAASFCPECGKGPVSKSSPVMAPKCENCGKLLFRGRGGRRYTIRYCTNCGLNFGADIPR